VVYLELIPNNLNTLLKEAKWALSNFKCINTINIPDILQIKIRSYDAAIYLEEHNIKTLPHIRVIDFSVPELIKLCQKLISKNIHQILLINGDPPPNQIQPIHKHNMPTIIQLIKKECPNLIIYAICDPYRQDLLTEINYCNEKISAGASGLFTQPIFTPHLSYILLEQLQHSKLFIGLSPVLSKKTYNYWVSRNNALFSPTFKITLKNNIIINKEIMKICKQYKQSNYIMPITTPLESYLKEVL